MKKIIFVLIMLCSSAVYAQWSPYTSYSTNSCNGQTGSCPPPPGGYPYKEVLLSSSDCFIDNEPAGIVEVYQCQRCSNLPSCCPTGQEWNQAAMKCGYGCPSGHTEIAGQCLPNVWCETLGGYISQNIECPPPNPQCDNGMVSCEEPNQDQNQPPPVNDIPGVTEGEEAGQQQGDRNDAIEQGQRNGAGAGASREAANNGGISTGDAEALSQVAEQSAEALGSSAEQVASDVYNACIAMEYDQVSCRNIAIGAGQGYETGGNVAGEVWDGINNGSLQPNDGDVCSPPAECGSNVYLSCPLNYVWNGSSSNPQCIPTTNPDICYPSYQNDYCNNYALNCQNGSFWSTIHESCIFDIPVDQCPSGTTLNVETGTCESNHIQPGNPTCPSGYQLTSLGCRPITTTTTTTRTETQNPDGSTTTTEITQTVGGNQGPVNVDVELDILNGPCDPSADDYLECTGLVQEYDESEQSQAITDLNNHGTQLLDDAGQSIIDGLEDVSTIDDSYADGVGGVLIDLYDFGTVTCNDIVLEFRDWSSSGGCQQTAVVRSILAWLLSLFTVWNIFSIATRGNQ